MPRSPHDTFILLFRSVMDNPVLWTKPFSRFQAWAWMIMKARVFSGLCIKRGQFIATRRYLQAEWGWDSEYSVRDFLKSLKAGWKDPSIEIEIIPTPRCASRWSPWFRNQPPQQKKSKVSPKWGPKSKSILSLKTSPKVMLVTILNYNEYQPSHALQSPKARPKNSPKQKSEVGSKVSPKLPPILNDDRNLTGGNECSNECTKEQEQIQTQPVADAPGLGVSENSQVYNLYIEKRRSALDKPDWKPTEAQAKQMRANINHILKTYPVQALTEMVERYMADQSLAKQKWPWTFFVADPIRWVEGKTKGATNYVDRALAKLQSEGL